MENGKVFRSVRGQSLKAMETGGVWRVMAYANGKWVLACTSFCSKTQNDCERYISKNLDWLHS